MSILVAVSLPDTFEQLMPRCPVWANVRVVNTGGSSVTIRSIVPRVTPLHGSYRVGSCAAKIEAQTIAAGASANFPFKVVFDGPLPQNGSSQDWTLGADVYLTDNTMTGAPPLALTTVQANAAAVAVAGQFLYASPLNSVNAFYF